MDEITLIEAIKSGITIISPSIQSVIVTLITTLFLRKNTNATELEKMKCGKFGEVIDNLVNSGKMSYLEFYKCRNFLNVAKLADEAIKNGDFKTSKESGFNFDWFMRFFDAVGNISNEDLQKLWGQVLANEIVKPKSCSLRTLDMIRNMSAEEAQTFTFLCRYVLESGNSYFIYPTGFYDEAEGYVECYNYMISKHLAYFNSIIPMLEIGVMKSSDDLLTYLNINAKLQIHNKHILCIVECESENNTKFQQEAYFLTASGFELYNIVRSAPDFEVDISYAVLCFKQMKKENSVFNISAYKIIEYDQDEPVCDFTNILTD